MKIKPNDEVVNFLNLITILGAIKQIHKLLCLSQACQISVLAAGWSRAAVVEAYHVEFFKKKLWQGTSIIV